MNANSFPEAQYINARSSAKEVVPYIIDLLNPKSVVDIGCGDGSWLKQFSEHHISEVIGIDAYYTNRNNLLIPHDTFISKDLTLPFKLNRRFDLALSLEVGEHLPASCASTFVTSITALSDIVIYSAAIPFQGGFKHINEQWPEYWKHLFEEKSYKMIDCLRFRFWDNKKVKWWYAQNMFLYIKKSSLYRYPKLKDMYKISHDFPISIVHPEAYLNKKIGFSLLLSKLLQKAKSIKFVS